MATREQLAENTGMYLLPRPLYETVVTDDFTYHAGPNNAWVLDIREPNVEWARAESRRRGLPLVEWWVGWSVRPSVADELLSAGLVPDDEPVLTGMTCATAPPEAPEIEVRPIETAAQYLEAIAVDWAVWEISSEERERRRAVEVGRFDQDYAAGTAHHWAAYDDGRPVGFGRGIDMEDGVALMGGAVLPEARGRGVYRALVRARWDHAAARGTPLLVVQAGRMSAPVLDGLGFVRHGEIRLYADRL
ncbi:MAG TPA: GNAT family N-acetyltransferase [Gaiellaceae bacterium]|jgi:GNAT superfamily N-acetyltransferase|nr:GNAT family N-acetyltransferase [Gaiellaceae bacterium]